MKIEWNKIEVNSRSSVEFSTKTLPGQKCNSSDCKAENGSIKIGGVLRRGEWAWLAHGCTLQIVSLRNGHLLCKQEFGFNNGCAIKSVAEVCSDNFEEGALLAVSLVSYCSSGGESFLVLYSVEQCTVLSCLQLQGHISSVSFMRPTVCRRSLLQNFDGCLAVGNDEGVVVLLDLSVHKLLTQHDPYDVAPKSCQIINYNLPLTDIHRHFQQSQQQGVHFGLQMEVIESPCSVQCMLPIDLILGLAIGLEDGRLAFYDLTELQIFYIAMPHSQLQMSPLVKMNYLEPPDDPRPCLYVWAVHEDGSNLTAVMHALSYEHRIIEMGTECFFETFQNSSVRLQLPLESDSGKGVAIGCQAIMKVTTHGEDDSHCLCALSWYAQSEKRSKLLIFDLNQWYKEEMPSLLNWQNANNYLAGFIPNGPHCALHVELNPCTIAHFNSMQRFEEHFYPNSLSFDCLLLLPEGSRCHNWEGTQNRVIGMLRASSAALFLEPDKYLNEILRIHLVPQFLDLNINSTFSSHVKYEILLSTALENNCFSLLRDCAKCWGDGSFTSNSAAPTSLSLETLTDWIWKRATHLTSSCNNLCKGLFGGYPLDQREQKELGFITRQVKMLSDLLGEVLGYSKSELSEKTLSILEFRHQSLRMAADYQAILLWLVNIGLLPEASPSCNIHSNLVPYPYAQLKTVYAKKRKFFAAVNDNFVSKKTGSCSLIFIDAFIEHEFKGAMVREFWLENNGDGLYPPTSIEAMLRVMLVPDVGFDSKCAILLYFFLDLHMAIDELTYKNVVNNFIKFPSVFKLSASLIKTVQSFWNLDHGHFLPAVDEFISPFNNNQTYQEWLLELLIETLLTQNGANLALRILEARPMIVPPKLKLKTLLANELISEAFHFARSRQKDSLLEIFFSCCLDTGKICDIRDLALNESEQELVQSLLKRSKTLNADNMHFVYLLQKSKYIDAVLFMDELYKTRCVRPWLGNENDYEAGTGVDTPNLILSAFNTTMAPVTLGLSDVYFRIRNKIQQKVTNASPVPLSCQLIQQNANNLLGGMYHSSALGAHFATYYWGNMESTKQSGISLLSSENAPFLRKPQNESNYLALVDETPISYPQTYNGSEKRTLAERDRHENDIQADTRNVTNPKKRRRLEGQFLIDNHSQSMNQIQQTSQPLSIPSKQEQQTEITTAFHFLTEPSIKLTKRSSINEDPRDDTIPLPIVGGAGINGILKTYTPEPLHSKTLCRDRTVDEEKNLRFKLPEFRQVSVQIENDACKHVLLSNNKQKVFTQSISGKSESNELESEENFHSPHSSTNSIFLRSGVHSMTPEAYMNSSICGPQPRKSLALFSPYHLEKSLTPESENKFDQITFEEPLKWSEPATVIPMPQISSATFLPNRISEFVPIVSSSRVGETNSKFILKTMTYHNELTDGSTVFGSLTFDDAASRTNEPYTRSASTPPPVSLTQKEPQFLDTTLGMSSYNLTVLDASGQASISSALQNYNSDAAESFEEFFDKQAVNNVYNIDDACDNSEEVREAKKSCNDDNVLVFDVTSSCSNCFSVDFKPPNANKKKSEYISDHENEAAIMLTTTGSESGRSNVGNEDGRRDLGVKFSEVKNKKDAKVKEELTSLELSIEKESAEENTEGSKSDDAKIQDFKYQRENNISKQLLNIVDPEGAENSLKTSSAAIGNIVHVKNNHSGNIYFRADNLAQGHTQYSDNNELSPLKDERVQMISAAENVRNEDLVVQKNCVSSKINPSSFNISYESLSKRFLKSYKLLKTDAQAKPADDGYNATYINKKDMEIDYDIELGLDDKLRAKTELTSNKVNPKEMSKILGPVESGPFSDRFSPYCDKKDSHEKNSFNDQLCCSNTNKSRIEVNKKIKRTVYDYSLVSESEENRQDNDFKVENTSLSRHKKKEGNSKMLEQNDNIQIATFKQNEDNETSSEMNQEIQVLDVSEDCNRKLSEPISQDKELIANKEFELKEHWTAHTIAVTNEINITVDGRNKMPDNTCKSTKSKDQDKSSKSRPQMIAAFNDSERDAFTRITPKTRRALRGTSVPPLLSEINVESITAPRKRSMRGISMPPQTTDNEDSQTVEKALLEQTMRSSAETTPRSHRVSNRRSIAPSNVEDNDDSMSKNSTTSVKKSAILLVPISKEAVTLDSPSSRTRSRLRLNSMDSELDASIASGDQTVLKRARRNTATSNVSEELLTPHRARRNSTTGQFESLDSQECIGLSTNSSVAMRDPNLPNTEMSYEKSDLEVSPVHTFVNTLDTASYSLSRRLTRTQLAVLKKSATIAAMEKVDSPSISVKGISRSSLTYPESDDNESISSNISGFSKSAVNRRVTRSSVKDTAEPDDDSISVVSSGSDRRRKRYSKDMISPNTILTAIPEDVSEVQDVPKRRGTSRKH